MKPSVFAAAVIFAALSLLNASEDNYNSSLGKGPSVEELSETIAGETEKIEDIIFEFTQQVFIAGSTDTVSAEVFYKRPHYFYLRYKEPVTQEIYFNGTELITYIPRIRQATSQQRDLRENILGVSAGLIYSPRGLGGLKEDHKLNVAGIESDTGNIILEAFPHDKSDYEKMTIIFDSENLRPLKTRISAPHAKSITRFSNYSINPGLKEDIFIFDRPEDVELMRMNNK